MTLPPIERVPHWRPQGADLYSTGASGAVPVRPINAANPVESMDRMGEGAIVKTPDKPSAPEKPNRDWTEPEEKKAVEEPVAVAPAEPVYKQLLDFIQTMWRASGLALDVAQEASKAAQQQNLAQQVKNEPTVQSAPSVKRTGGA